MIKRLVLILTACLMTIFMNPTVLTALDSVVAKAPEFHAVKTVLEEPKTEVAAEPSEDFSDPILPLAPMASLAGAQNSAPAPQIRYQVSAEIGSLNQFVKTHNNLSYSDIYRFKKLVYGHNTANLMGNLASLTVGDTFEVVEGGVATSYRVAAVNIYENTENGLAGDPSLMGKIAYSALGHDLALLTCAGQMYESGGASHRLVVFADFI